MRVSKKVKIKDASRLKQQLLCWAQQYNEVVWFDSNDHKDHYSQIDAMLAVDAFTAVQTDYHRAFEKLQEYQEITKDWIFGYLSYDLKNDVEQLKSDNHDQLGFPDLFFFQPKRLFILRGGELEMQYLGVVDDEMEEDLEQLLQKEHFGPEFFSNHEGIQVKPRISREDYYSKVEKILAHIHRGDIYEANFCQEFYAEEVGLDPLHTFSALNKISRPPFASFFKNHEHFLLSASPERYLQKIENTLISQPIKGTAPRDLLNPERDLRLCQELEQDSKERSENIMIVDLVRNDLSKTAKKGSVQVPELCKVYSFQQVHQMISTVTAQLEEGIPPVEVLKTTFPMGSMTGAPKISAMEIIEHYEESRRGLYSGAVGYFDPNGNFDFNVVIRSILYNAKNKYVSFSVGGAITSRSIPEKEYEECLIKAGALKQVLEGQKQP
ncbi:anthranilate synthase component I family protein [Salinimicrobium oceani]|uniref:Anthranilate synthase component I family protein n=1 Tax=Salinimicrobium oceani TaxID=2722702 RepID=A0ABX1CU98_9FLAO|nr:anthranilate synthase component I family protein [Salinimicrobium oceani]NJW51337.1 anthranilate synthase component I family protein [Salinimicrobium oceani]